MTIFGTLRLESNTLTTHRDTYVLQSVSVISVRRPFLAPGILVAIGSAGFAVPFADLLYLHEIMALTGIGMIALGIGLKLGQLKLLSRDLRGSELSDAVWGTYDHLGIVRREIADRLALLAGERGQ